MSASFLLLKGGTHMFFMMGIHDSQRRLDFTQTIICDGCGGYGRYEVFLTFTVLSLFFIPCFRWNRRFFVRTTCCNRMYELDPRTGQRIARGEAVEITPVDLKPLYQGGRHSYKRCQNCGFLTQEDFEFCPKCGCRLS